MIKTNIQVKVVMKVAIITIIANVLLSTLTFIIGLALDNTLLITESFDNLSDILIAIVVIIGIRVAVKEDDKNHPYGHERFECITALIISVIIAFVAVFLGMGAVETIINMDYKDSTVVSFVVFIAPITEMIVKETLFWYVIRLAKKYRSSVLKADAWQNRADVFTSIATVVGFMGTYFGFNILEPIAIIIVCIFILKTSIGIFVEAISKVIDSTCSDVINTDIKNTILNCEQVLYIEVLKTRQFGERIYVDAEIILDSTLTFIEAHNVTELVHSTLEQEFEDIKHCTVHASPNVVT